MEFSVSQKTCPRCGHVWLPRILNPQECPKCTNRLDKPPRKEKKK